MVITLHEDRTRALEHGASNNNLDIDFFAAEGNEKHSTATEKYIYKLSRSSDYGATRLKMIP